MWGLKTVARFHMPAELLLGVETFRVDLAARRRILEITDLSLQARHIHVSIHRMERRCMGASSSKYNTQS
jgi:hypothetical protein